MKEQRGSYSNRKVKKEKRVRRVKGKVNKEAEKNGKAARGDRREGGGGMEKGREVEKRSVR